jgi:glycerol kinase
MSHYLLAIDQGTTNSRAIIFDSKGIPISQHETTLNQHFPKNGWVEQDADEMYRNTITCCKQAMKNANLSAKSIAAIGITNQRETTIIWNKHTGKTIYPAIVWQDRRTSDICDELKKLPIAKTIQEKTGLLLDPYFSATKIMWILSHIAGAREQATKGDLLFGTVDTYLLWRLTNGKVHATDASNASRTLLFNIRTQKWDDEILKAFNIPDNILPAVCDNIANFGNTEKEIFGECISIAAMAGDQQAATIGQACFNEGMVKSTYGTGCFLMLNTGKKIIRSHNKLLSTILYRINNETTYGLEGSIFSAGVAVKWLRDTLQIISNAAETESLAKSIEDTNGVYLVPAFTGLGAPHWDPKVRAALVGLTCNSNRAHIVRAALESVAYQTHDLLQAMTNDYQHPLTALRVDGGMTKNNWLMQFLANIVNTKVERPTCIETTALGVAYLAGLQVGIFSSLKDIAKHWQLDKVYQPTILSAKRESLCLGWQKAVAGAFASS